MTYLCHKCHGVLTSCDDPRAYGCDCISGYVRDWQKPTPTNQVRALQITAILERLRLYANQRRPSNESNVLYARARLKRWDDWLYPAGHSISA